LKILITSIGITGKSTFHKWLATVLCNFSHEVLALDLDYERDKIPKEFKPETIYIFEDVHGPCKNAVIPLKEYDLVLYLRPSWLIHLKFWSKRMIRWWENGQFAWDADKGKKGAWAGTNKRYDWHNIPGIIRYFWDHFPRRRTTIKEDLITLIASGIPTCIIIPSGNATKMSVAIKFL